MAPSSTQAICCALGEVDGRVLMNLIPPTMPGGILPDEPLPVVPIFAASVTPVVALFMLIVMWALLPPPPRLPPAPFCQI